MKLSVIVPVYNEENNIKEVVKKVEKVNIDKEIIIVDDGSTDKTSQILNYFKGKDIKVFTLANNSGKGVAIREGLRRVRGDLVLIQDADLEYDTNDYHTLVKPIMTGKAEVVYGSRFRGKIKYMQPSHFIANKLLTFVTNLLYGAEITDEATCYKVFKTELIKKIPLKCKRFEFCPEVTAKILKRGVKITEVPISYKARTIKEGKKLSLWDGWEAVFTLIKYRLMD